MRIIDADRVEFLVKCCKTYHGVIAIDTVQAILKDVHTIPTKQIKYYDEDENVWKIGEVIVDE